MREERHVIPNKDGGWDVVAPGHARESHAERKREAASLGRELLRNDGGGELVIHSRGGKIVERDTVRADHRAD
jgi:hypothetical protein